MKEKSLFIGIVLYSLILMGGCVQQKPFPDLTGPYLGQTPPGDTPQVFAPEIVCTGLYERDVAITPDGREFYFGVIVGNNAYSVIMMTKRVNGRWTKPEVAAFSGDPRYRDLEPCISPDGSRFFFVSNRPDTDEDETDEDWDIWVMDRTAEGWSAPYNLGPPVNTDDGEFFPSITRGGTLYFTRGGQKTRSNFIYRSRFVDGQFTEPEKLGTRVNSTQNQFNAFIAPDEDYLIVPTFGREDSHGSTDYYICFRTKDDTWSEPINLGDKINTPGGLEWSPYVSLDGKYFFFMSARTRKDDDFAGERLTRNGILSMHNRPQNGNPDIYWVNASFIETLRPEGF
jgi:hypothetical protein